MHPVPCRDAHERCDYYRYLLRGPADTREHAPSVIVAMLTTISQDSYPKRARHALVSRRRQASVRRHSLAPSCQTLRTVRLALQRAAGRPMRVCICGRITLLVVCVQTAGTAPRCGLHITIRVRVQRNAGGSSAPACPLLQPASAARRRGHQAATHYYLGQGTCE